MTEKMRLQHQENPIEMGLQNSFVSLLLKKNINSNNDKRKNSTDIHNPSESVSFAHSFLLESFISVQVVVSAKRPLHVFHGWVLLLHWHGPKAV